MYTAGVAPNGGPTYGYLQNLQADMERYDDFLV